jgi:O-antigen/teichoic acid export membrane protein
VSGLRAVARGTLRLLAGLMAGRVFDFALYLLLARRFGVEQFGAYTYALSFVLLFGVLADFGVTTVLTREVARAPRRTRALLVDALTLKLGLSVATIVTVFVVALVSRSSPATLALMAALTVGMLLRSAALVFDGLLRAANRAGAVGIGVLCSSVTGLAVATALVLGGLGVMGGAIAYALSGLVHLAAVAWPARDLWRVRIGDGAAATLPEAPVADVESAAAAPWRGQLGLLRECAPLALSGIFIALYFRIDAVMLHALQDDRAVGLYGGIYRVFEVFAMLAVAFRSVLFPVMARAADGPRAALAVLCRKSLRLHLLFTVLVAVFFTVESRTIITIILGSQYAPAALGLSVLIWALPGSFMADTLLHLLIAQRRQALGTWAVGAAAGFNVALNFALIPRFSFVGAAAATVASELVCFGLLFAIFRRGAPGVSFLRTAWPPIVAGAAAAGALAWVAPHLPPTLAGLVVAGMATLAVYTAALMLLGGIGRADLVAVRGLLPSERARVAREVES